MKNYRTPLLKEEIENTRKKKYLGKTVKYNRPNWIVNERRLQFAMQYFEIIDSFDPVVFNIKSIKWSIKGDLHRNSVIKPDKGHESG